jgi:hypothetical protein
MESSFPPSTIMSSRPTALTSSHRPTSSSTPQTQVVHGTLSLRRSRLTRLMRRYFNSTQTTRIGSSAWMTRVARVTEVLGAMLKRTFRGMTAGGSPSWGTTCATVRGRVTKVCLSIRCRSCANRSATRRALSLFPIGDEPDATRERLSRRDLQKKDQNVRRGRCGSRSISTIQSTSRSSST